MSDSNEPQSASAQALPSTIDESATALDAHGYDPDQYDWYPVLRRPRADGWTPAKQRLFIETLADTASPKQATDAVGMSRESAYKLRRSPGGEGFAAAWDAAIQQGSKRLVDLAFERAVDGVEEPVWDAEGRVIGLKTRYNDGLLMFLLRSHQPERYRFAARDVRQANEPPPPQLPPVADAVARLAPARPDKPHELMDSEELEARVMVADMCGGEMPHWHRPEPRKHEPGEWETEAAKKVDAMLDEVRRQNNPHWDPEAVSRAAEEEEEEERRERESRRARRRARGRAR